MADEHLKEYVSRVSTPARRDADGEGLTLPEHSGAYQAFARATTEPVYTLHCLLGPAGVRSFQYVQLESDSSFTVEKRGQVISLRFSGVKTVAVIIRGRNLRKLYDLVHQHRIPWVMQLEAGRDFAAGDEAVITSIDFPEVGEDGELRSGHGPAKVLEMG
jgi:hypothetical protein